MNIINADRDLRNFTAKPAPARAGRPAATQPTNTPATQVTLSLSSSAKTLTIFGFKNDPSTNSTESKAPDSSDKLRSEESVHEQTTELPEDSNDPFENYHGADEKEEPPPEEKEQHPHSNQRLEALTERYRSQLLLLDGLLKRLGTTTDSLTQWQNSTPTYPQPQTTQPL